MNPLAFLVIAVVFLGLILMVRPKERFQPEFLDKSQVQKTVAVQDSSYNQTTNHADPAPFSMGPIEGVETPFQINQYRAFV